VQDAGRYCRSEAVFRLGVELEGGPSTPDLLCPPDCDASDMPSVLEAVTDLATPVTSMVSPVPFSFPIYLHNIQPEFASSPEPVAEILPAEQPPPKPNIVRCFSNLQAHALNINSLFLDYPTQAFEWSTVSHSVPNTSDSVSAVPTLSAVISAAESLDCTIIPEPSPLVSDPLPDAPLVCPANTTLEEAWWSIHMQSILPLASRASEPVTATNYPMLYYHLRCQEGRPEANYSLQQFHLDVAPYGLDLVTHVFSIEHFQNSLAQELGENRTYVYELDDSRTKLRKHPLLVVPLRLGGRTYRALVDGGAMRSLVTDEVARNLQQCGFKKSARPVARLAGFAAGGESYAAYRFSKVSFSIGETAKSYSHDLLTGPIRNYDIILGNDFLEEHGFIVDHGICHSFRERACSLFVT
jgi:hypothetical protein